MPKLDPSNSRPFSLIVGFENSPCSQDALETLTTAGLPLKGSAVVLSVAETMSLGSNIGDGFELAEQVAALEQTAVATAAKGADQLRTILTGWDVRPVAVLGSSYQSLLNEAAKQRADLIVVGSHGHSAVERVLLGSTSQFAVANAHCSVRIGRDRAQTTAASNPPHLFIAIDGSPGADAVVDEVARRRWPAGTVARLLIAVDIGTSVSIRSLASNDATRSLSLSPEIVLERAATTLSRCGLDLSGELKAGSPKQVIVEQAQYWKSDTIFVGAQGHSRFERMMLGSVSAAVAARAHCSVEVVRRTGAPSGG